VITIKYTTEAIIKTFPHLYNGLAIKTSHGSRSLDRRMSLITKKNEQKKKRKRYSGWPLLPDTRYSAKKTAPPIVHSNRLFLRFH